MKQNEFLKKFVDFAIIDMTIEEKNQVSKYLMILLWIKSHESWN